jgi:hypothetical protein
LRKADAFYRFAKPLPVGVGVPNYAYLDVETSNTFDITAASAAGKAIYLKPNGFFPFYSSKNFRWSRVYEAANCDRWGNDHRLRR